MSILCLVSLLSCFLNNAVAQTPGSFADGGDTLVSAMMMFVGNEQRVYILDKAEGNSHQINGHPAWGAVWHINTRNATVMDVKTNTFCAAGMHLPNGSFATFGGNAAVGTGGRIGSERDPSGVSAVYDATYQDYDGRKSIRILNPCRDTDDFSSPACQWYDNATFLAMQKQRWYAGVESLGDGSVVLIGGFVNGGYVNRNVPNVDPAFEGGAAEPTYEFFPTRGPAQIMQFMVKTSGLNSYAHAYLLASGRMFVQANLSTIIWDYEENVESPLPDMPKGVARVYPASGAVAMLPLTPANNYSQTILFCGGTDLPADAYGNYSFPFINVWEHQASRDCQRITPEPFDGSPPTYVQDEDMPDPRTMGQFIALPDGTLLVVNGGTHGTAGYADVTAQTTSPAAMPFGQSLATGPVGRPSIYNASAPLGSRWSTQGLSSSSIPRLYHSTAILLPDASVLIAGSNPNFDVNTTTIYPTTYKAEIFYPPYFASQTRPVLPSNVPSTISYGGPSFDLTLPPSSYTGNPNTTAQSAIVSLVRPGFTTHAMNMGQRFLQLNNTFTVSEDLSITLHVAQAPPNPRLFTPGPALLFVVVNGAPSRGAMVIVGNGEMGPQPVAAATMLPDSVYLNTTGGRSRSGVMPGVQVCFSWLRVSAIVAAMQVVSSVMMLGLF